MRPVSGKFLAAVTGSHRVSTRARILAPGYNGTNPGPLDAAGQPINALDVTDGSIRLDSTAQVRGILALTTKAGWPVAAADTLTPYGSEVFVERGVVYGDGSTEWVSQGYYRIDDMTQAVAPNGVIDLSNSPDRMQRIIDARIPAPIQFPAGTARLDVITNLVLDAVPWAVLDVDPSLASSSLETAQTTTDDRYLFLNDLITAFGMVWYWDHRGILVIKKPPSATTPVVTLKTGRGGVLVSLSRELVRTGIYNGCVAEAQQTDPTIPAAYALVVDNDPSSPTYWFGPFGKVPQFFSSSFLTNTEQCQSAATSILQSGLGLPYNIDMNMVPNFSLEPLDCVAVQLSDIPELHTLTTTDVPLSPATAMEATSTQLLSRGFSVVG